MGTVLQKHGHWYLRYEGPRDPNTGKRHQRQHKAKDQSSKTAALKELKQLEAEVARGESASSGRITVKEHLRTWLASCRSEIGQRTWEHYEQVCRNHLIPGLGKRLLSDLRPQHIKVYYTDRLERGRADGKGGLSAKSVLQHHLILHRALQVAIEWQLLPRNPCDRVRPPRVERYHATLPTSEDLLSLLDQLRETPYYLPLLLLAATGARRGEVLGLQWRDVDLDRSTVLLARTLNPQKGGAFVKGLKNDRPRAVLLPGFAVDALRVERMLRQPKADNWICVNEEGQPFQPARFSKNLLYWRRKLGLDRFRLHDIRHYQATQLLNAGVPVKAVSERLGHSSTALTLDIYTHMLAGMDERAAGVVERLLGEKREVLEEGKR